MPETQTPTQSYIVLFDLPARGAKSKFYRRLRELLGEQGGSAHCRATRSAYIVEGDHARDLAFAIGALASAFGAGKIGEQGGVVVLPLGTLEPRAHFAAIKRAEDAVANLVLDRRTVRGKRAPRTLSTTHVFDPNIIDLTQVLREQRESVQRMVAR
jgi:hypothetical protein